ncbi:flavin monoamine oxidase family protein [Agreia sp.]|uniref:flavin monoamine oxidase family protein n=1 Tax=Agreia sp. TaxID=1872416 RepID=UPI0035BC2924
MTKDYDAVVVGSGLAGSIAARELQQRGKRTVILEARDRVGGRAFTTEFGGGSIEMGGQNVYWTEPFIWSEISRYRLPIAEVVPFQTYAVSEGGNLNRYPAAAAAKQLGAGFDAFFGDNADIMPRPMDPTFRREALQEIDQLSIRGRLEAIDLDHEVLRWLRPWLEMRTGGAPETGAYAWLLHIWSLADWQWQKILTVSSRYRVATGMKSLIDAIQADAGADLELNSPVVRIDDQRDRVLVTTAGGEEYAAHGVVVATSANMWSTIDFGGRLSPLKQQSSVDGMQTPVSFTKLWALVDGPVDNVYVQNADTNVNPIIHLRKDLERPDGLTQVIAFSVDPTVAASRKAEIPQFFEELLPSNGKARIVETKALDWVAEPFSRGGTSLLRPGQLSRIDQIAASEGRVAFATADIATAAPGFDGAIQTGIRAAYDVLRATSR